MAVLRQRDCLDPVPERCKLSDQARWDRVVRPADGCRFRAEASLRYSTFGVLERDGRSTGVAHGEDWLSFWRSVVRHGAIRDTVGNGCRHLESWLADEQFSDEFRDSQNSVLSD